MSVYIEVVIIDNFVVTFLLGRLSYRLIRLRGSLLRLFIAAAAGTACALFYPLVDSIVLSLVVKLSVWLMLGLILFFKKAKRFFSAALLFLGLTFVFGGGLFAVGFAATGSAQSAMEYSLFDFPVGLLLLGGAGVYKGLQLLGLKLNRIKDIGGLIYDCSVSLFSNSVRLHGMMDTGNRLYDKVTGLPVVVVSAKSLLPILSDEQVRLLFSGRGEALQKHARYMRYGTLAGGDTKILLLKPDTFLLYLPGRENILYDVMLGVNVTLSSEYEAILHPALL